MTLPERFHDATFESYEPQMPSQAKALRVAQGFVAEQQRVPPWTERIQRLFGATSEDQPQGLYLVGPAGTGKTHLLAATINALAPEVPCTFLHSSTLFRQTEPPDAFAHRLADRYSVCCLDEVEIDDPANEMRLAGLMKTLAARGVPLLATSNVEPEQYMATQLGDGRIQRFLQTEVRERYRVVGVNGGDYRRTQEVQQSGRGWIGPPEPTRRAMRQAQVDAAGASRWWSFAELHRATTETAHPKLIADLVTLDHFFVEGLDRRYRRRLPPPPRRRCAVPPRGGAHILLYRRAVAGQLVCAGAARRHRAGRGREVRPHRFPSSCAVPGPGGRTGRSAPLLSPHLPTPTLPYANTLTRRYAIPRSAPPPGSPQSPRPAAQSRPARRSESPRTR